MKIKAAALQLSSFSPSAVLPQAIGTIWSYVMQDPLIQDNYELVQVFWENEGSEEVLQEIGEVDVLLCSCYLWNWERTIDVIREYRKSNPSCMIIVGGPQPKYSKDWLVEFDDIDVIIPFYGEEGLRRLLINYQKIGKDVLQKEIEGAITKKIPSAKALVNFYDHIPSPYLNGFFDKLITRKRGETIFIRAVFESNRGCPYSCTFCDVGSKRYRKLVRFEMDRVMAELKWMVKNNIHVIDVADANFGILDRDEEIVDYLIKLKKEFPAWKGSFLPTWSKSGSKRVLSIAKKILNNQLDSIFGLSIQSLNPGTLKNIKRTNPFSLLEMSEVTRDLNLNGVPVYTEIIFPLPGDTKENFITGIKTLLDLPYVFNKFQLNQLSFLTNSEIAKDDSGVEWRRIRGFTRHYSGDKNSDIIAVSNPGISRDDVFECLFLVKYFLIPFYFYGIVRGSTDIRFQLGDKRSDTLFDIYETLFSLGKYKKFKEKMKGDYISFINGEKQYGYKLTNLEEQYFPEFAFAHRWYLDNDVYDDLNAMFPELCDLFEFDIYSQRTCHKSSISKKFNFDGNTWVFEENREVSTEELYNILYIRERFSDSWRKEIVRPS